MSAMLETYDAQMLDFQADPDYSMQTTLSNDAWFQDEAAMEDDGHTPVQNTIEVDMEPYDEHHHHPEYDMEDAEALGENTDTVLDVEVYDASRFHSPDPLEPPTELSQATAESIEPSYSSQVSTEAQHPDDMQNLHPLLHTETLEDPALFPTENHHSIHRPGIPDEPVLLSSENHHSVQHTEILDQAALIPSESHHPILHTEIQDEVAPADETVPSTEVPHGLESVHVPPVDDSINAIADNNHTENQPDAEEQEVLSEEATKASEIQAPAEAHAEYSGGETAEQVEEYTQPFELEGSTGDPHEISEGVYIDPPPPVLMSLSTDVPTISLFNSPSKSRLNSPLQIDSDVPDFVILLGQHPTLYYEPLSSVFEMLRQEEYLSDIPDLLSGELFFDAYDLELSLSEDYTYAHELSLHDLNVLHDGLNKPGPLRLRLRSLAPRFIDRYHMLQEQIAHFHVAVNTEAETSGDDAEGSGPRPTPGEGPTLEAESGIDSASAEATEEETTGFDAGAHELEQHEHEERDHEGDGPTAEDSEVAQKAEQGEEELIPGNEQDSLEEGSASRDTVAKSAHSVVSSENDSSNGNESEHAHLREEDDHNEIHGQDDEPDLPQEDHYEPSPGDVEAGDEHELSDEDGENSVEHANTSNHDDETELQKPVVVPASAVDEYTTGLEPTGGIVEPEQANPLADAILVGDDAAKDALYAQDDEWDDNLDGEGEWEGDEPENEELGHDHETNSNLSSVTLSSKASVKRSLSEAEIEDFDENDFPPSSPGLSVTSSLSGS
ncbi:hypothetical protein H0H92_000675 [Tricholoma furcatifolium]|nr:hypothetical protein H0H92_000675 [Tricholoma furcatifolium]